MKKVIIFFPTIFLIFTTSIKSQLPNTPPSIEVNGTATIKVNPDILNLSLYVQVDNSNVSLAKNENDNAVFKVLDVLKNYGILDKDVQTSGVSVYKNYGYDDEKHKEYSVYNYITCKLKELSKYYDIIAELVKIEHLYISYSTYEYSDVINTRKDARERALIAAKNKAIEMAAALGQDIGKPLQIAEEQPDYYYPYSNNVNQQVVQNQSYSSTSGILKEGTIDVTAKVRVVFELINK